MGDALPPSVNYFLLPLLRTAHQGDPFMSTNLESAKQIESGIRFEASPQIDEV